jgi:hypothetical protein
VGALEVGKEYQTDVSEVEEVGQEYQRWDKECQEEGLVNRRYNMSIICRTRNANMYDRNAIKGRTGEAELGQESEVEHEYHCRRFRVMTSVAEV